MFYCKFRGRLVHVLKHMFSVFKQYFTHFHTPFHSHVFPKNTNNATKTTLPNGPLQKYNKKMEVRKHNIYHTRVKDIRFISKLCVMVQEI